MKSNKDKNKHIVSYIKLVEKYHLISPTNVLVHRKNNERTRKKGGILDITKTTNRAEVPKFVSLQFYHSESTKMSMLRDTNTAFL